MTTCPSCTSPTTSIYLSVYLSICLSNVTLSPKGNKSDRAGPKANSFADITGNLIKLTTSAIVSFACSAADLRFVVRILRLPIVLQPENRISLQNLHSLCLKCFLITENLFQQKNPIVIFLMSSKIKYSDNAIQDVLH